MKKHDNKWKIRLASVALAGVCLCGASLAVGDVNDPLVGLSYLNEKTVPEIMQQVETQAEEHQNDLMTRFYAAIASYKTEKEEGTLNNATYSVVTLKRSQRIELGVGCEVMLRVGSATVSAATSPALIDVTTGGTITKGTALTKNHLYMATIADRTLTATADTVKLLVRGNYVIL